MARTEVQDIRRRGVCRDLSRLERPAPLSGGDRLVSATTGVARSIHVRLVVRAKDLGIEPQLLLERYALHRLLYRLSLSKHVERFLLKGAQLMLLWLGETVRSTRDADLLGFG
ncbi:MAG: nucleotidyl transferase AbiEii/AbiGii toxin family protein, partial [bacterium]